ncbi:MAG TPA: prephenate dehydrogenase [Syntrophomonadaceae bacterium]|nr:prephenate dehydrogenase [Syntrophomonadaceae bacterium]
MKVKVLLVGVGLIGGSLGLSLRESPLVDSVMGADNDSEALAKACEIGAIDRIVRLEEGVQDADLIFLCTPLGSYASIIEKIRPFLRPGTLVSDVGSTKLAVMDLFQSLPREVYAVGGHPMAGAETQGINGADRYLFENAVYVLTPGKETPAAVLDMLMEILRATGARIEIIEAAVHDELVATVSHIPHLSAVALVGLTEGSQEHLMMAAGGFRDTTRVASSNPQLWEDILFSNRLPLLERLDSLIERLGNIRTALEQNDHTGLRRELNQAKEIRDCIPHIRRSLLPSCHDLVCIVPDRPGIIGQLGSILDGEDINIVDIEILRVREGDGGTIRLGVPTLEKAEQAVKALQANDIKAWLR